MTTTYNSPNEAIRSEIIAPLGGYAGEFDIEGIVNELVVQGG